MKKVKKGGLVRPFFMMLIGFGAQYLAIDITQASDFGLYSNIDSLTYSEAMSIKGFIDNFSGELESGTTALTHDRAEVGMRYRDWWVARILRYDYTLEFSEDTALLNYQIENNLEIDDARSYSISLRAKHLRSTGFMLGRQWQIKPGLKISSSVSWLASEQFYDGVISAELNQGNYQASDLEEFESLIADIDTDQINTLNDIATIGSTAQEASERLRNAISSTKIQGYADYYYYKPALREDEFDDFNDVNLVNPSGQGYTFDFALQWEFHPKWVLDLEVRDIWSQIRWERAPATRVRADVSQAALSSLDVVDQFIAEDVIKRSQGQFFTPLNPSDPDDPGAVLPEIEAQIIDEHSDVNVRNENYVQELPRQIYASIAYQLVPWVQLQTGWVETEVKSFPHVKAQFFDHYWVRYEIEPGAIGFGFDSRYTKIGLMADSTDIDKAKYLYLQLSVNIPLF